MIQSNKMHLECCQMQDVGAENVHIYVISYSS